MAKNTGIDSKPGMIEEGDDFEVVQTSRLMWDPNTCGPVRGYLLDVKQFDSEINDDGIFKCYLIQLTRDCQARSREDKTKLVTAKKGEQVLVPFNYELGDLVEKVRDPRGVFEVIITPKGKTAISGGKTMHTYEVKASKKTIPWLEFGSSYAPRTLTEGPSNGAVPQLSAADAANPAVRDFVNG